MKKLSIAQVAPLYESVPPKFYGGTERVVSNITEELVALGHNVTLFASGDSITRANLIPVCDQALRLSTHWEDPLAHHMIMLQRVLDMSEKFDVIHFHIDYLHFPLSKLMRLPHVTTLHGRLNLPDLKQLYDVFHDMPVISISNSQRKPLPNINWKGTVYHGLPEKLFAPMFQPGKYLAFLGRISQEKGVDSAIDIAIRSGIPLKIAAKIDPSDKIYFETHIRKLLDHPLIEFIGEISEREKNQFLGNALALIFPINWEEPFGMVMIESMACGTPVVAYARGSVSEVIEHGVNGFLVDNPDDAVKAVQNIGLIDRRECRRTFDERFTARRMAMDYLNIYRKILEPETDIYELKVN